VGASVDSEETSVTVVSVISFSCAVTGRIKPTPTTATKAKNKDKILFIIPPPFNMRVVFYHYTTIKPKIKVVI
jgi:hypothetical protein